MKKIIYTLLINAMMISCANATHLGSDLKIRMHDYRAMIVELDHINYNSPTTEFRIDELAPGRHQINIWTLRNHHNYGQPRLAYRGYIDIPAQSKVTARLTEYQQLKVVRIEPKYVLPDNCQTYETYDPYHYNTPTAVVPVSNHCGNFEELKDIIRHQNFDNTKVKIAKDYMRDNRICTKEVSDLMCLLTFESNKLDLAKFAYEFVDDPQNYFRLYDEFTFDSSVRDLSDYIHSRS